MLRQQLTGQFHQVILAGIWTSRYLCSRTFICNSVLLSINIQNQVRLDYNRNVIYQQILAVIWTSSDRSDINLSWTSVDVACSVGYYLRHLSVVLMLRLIGVCRPTCRKRLSCWLCRGTTVRDVSICVPACGELFKLRLLFHQRTASARSHCAAVWKTEKTMSGGGLMGHKQDFPWREQGSRLICDQERLVFFNMCNVRKLTYINGISRSMSPSYLNQSKISS